MTPPSTCEFTQASFSAYLDGAVNGADMQQIASHLDSCSDCAREFTAWRSMQDTLSMLRTAKAPQDLGLKLRLAISREKSKRMSSVFDTISLYWDNTARPMLVQVSAGFAMAVVLLGAIVFLCGSVAVPSAVRADDEPLGAMTAPHYLYSTDEPRPILTAHDTTIVVEARINSQGRVYDYTIISDPQSPAVRAQIEDQLLLSVFQPASVFGTPVRSHMLLTYDGVSVHG
ncbi:anti-sigma factor family protein [Granulicella arctica]|uniref:anti-sigma factor family protein n=1 Tax=Granulicella arctica TaxID=940613 RepID=UPI0021DFCCE3|nr:anti-sigma factor [Granulicella arctica]